MSTVKDLIDLLPTIEWLWPSWIPRGFVSMLAGYQGEGKSYVALSMVRSFLFDQPWPDGFRSGKTEKKVLWLDCEARQATLSQRCSQWKLPVDRIVIPDEPLSTPDLGNPNERQKVINLIIREDIPFVIVDSLSGSHTTEETSNRDMANLLRPLSILARDRNIALLTIHHVRKRHENEPEEITLERIRGAMAITQFCISVMVKETVKGVQRLRMEKCNLVQKPHPIGVSIKENEQGYGDVYFTGPLDIPVSSIDYDPAADWLAEELAEGPLDFHTLSEHAHDLGISWRQIYKAHRILGVKKLGRKWVLPNTSLFFETTKIQEDL